MPVSRAHRERTIIPKLNELNKSSVLAITVLALLFVFPYAVASTTAQLPSADEKPLWHLTPRELGYDLPVKPSFAMQLGRAHIKPFFLDFERVAFAWFVPDQIPTASPNPNVPGRIHVAVLDAHSGRPIVSHDWNSWSRQSDIVYTAGGQWLILSAGVLTLWSASFEEVRTVSVDKTATYGESPLLDRRTCLIPVMNSPGRTDSELVNSDTFEILDSWPGRIGGSIHNSDSYLARISAENQLAIRKIGDSWKVLSFDPKLFDMSHPELPAAVKRFIEPLKFIADDRLVVAPYPRANQLAVVTVEGQVLLSEKLRGDRDFSDSSIVSGNDRFAIINRRKRGSGALDMMFFADERVHVYDLKQRSEIFALDVKGDSPWPPFAMHWNSVAMSLDGKLLAIASDDAIRVYELPTS